MPRYMTIQVQPERAPGCDAESLVGTVTRFLEKQEDVAHLETVRGFDRVQYINISLETEHPRKLWNALKRDVFKRRPMGPHLSRASIVVCQGRHGWEDYLTLHHFDRRR
jgi:hypothetical protein